MAEIKLSDLPLMSEADFTANDRFVMVNDGNGSAMSKTVFDSWIANNVQGEKGEQGVAGRDGANGTNGRDGVDGADGLSAYQVAVNSGYTGTQEQWLLSLKGATGAAGANGSNGWSPVLRTVARGNDNVLQVFDWSGGSGSKPSITGYVGDSGIVTNIANATNIRGLKGDKGEGGEQGVQGEAGVDGREVQSITFNPDLTATVTFTDGSEVVSDPLPKQQGWGSYKDSQYTSSSPFLLSVSSQAVIPNNASEEIENLPVNVASFYNPLSQKYLLQDPDGLYSVRVRFKTMASDTPSFINLSMSKDTTEVPFSEDKVLRGDSSTQDFTFSTEIYGDSALATNGLSIRIKTYDRAVSVYNIEVLVAKII